MFPSCQGTSSGQLGSMKKFHFHCHRKLGKWIIFSDIHTDFKSIWEGELGARVGARDLPGKRLWLVWTKDWTHSRTWERRRQRLPTQLLHNCGRSIFSWSPSGKKLKLFWKCWWFSPTIYVANKFFNMHYERIKNIPDRLDIWRKC